MGTVITNQLEYLVRMYYTYTSVFTNIFQLVLNHLGKQSYTL